MVMKRLGYIAVTSFGAGALAALLLLAMCNPSCAEDYYCVSTTGIKASGVSTTDIAAFGWADADCYGTVSDALAQMSGGDQCWIDDGTYSTSGTVATIGSGLSGTPGDSTVLKARNAGQVYFNSTSGSGVYVNGSHDVYVEGLHIESCADAGAAYYILGSSRRVKVKRCSFQMDTFLVTDGSSLVLAEDCVGYGGPIRYAFQTSSGADSTIFRRCIVRWDYSNVNQPTACFASYTCDAIAYQNCVAVDCTDNIGINHAEDGTKGFFTPNGSTNISYEGSMVIATTGMAGWWLEGTNVTATLTDCVAWNLHATTADSLDSYEPIAFASTDDNISGVDLLNCTFGEVEWGGWDNNNGGKVGPLMSFNQTGSQGETMYDCIIAHMVPDAGAYAVGADCNAYDYNLYYDISGNRYNEDGVGANAITGVEPETNGLVSPLYVNPCSTLWTSGSTGGPIGAQIRSKIGVDGTYYGDTGWDSDTGNTLWPWPYQDEWRSKCSAWSMEADSAYAGSPAMDGARGFCGTGETLTSWLLKGGE